MKEIENIDTVENSDLPSGAPVKKKEMKNAYDLHITFAIAVIFLFIVNTAKGHGVDSDYYFIVNTGKWIVENHKIPSINIWTIHEDFKLVIQQWILCILQYRWYNLFDSEMLSLTNLGVVFSLIFNISLCRYIRQHTKSVETMLVTVVLANIAASGYFSARPNIITASTLMIELTLLHRYYVKNEISKRHFLIEMIVLSVWQINFQAASWYFLFIMILPYIVPPFWKKGWISSSEVDYHKRIRTGLVAMMLIFLSGFINPQGIRAMLYLFNSSNLASTGKHISELNAASVTSATGLMIIFEVALFGIALQSKKLSTETLWLCLGTLILAIDAVRNCYMIVLGLVPLVASVMKQTCLQEKCKTSKLNYVIIKITYIIAIAAISCVVLYQLTIAPVNEEKDNALDYSLRAQVEYIEMNDDRPKEELRLYTTFESGQYFQFNGFKTYMDARPELYMTSINGQYDVWNEWCALVDGKLEDEDIQEFLDSYNFDYLCSGRLGYLGSYLQSSDEYEEVVRGKSYSLYKHITN